MKTHKRLFSFMICIALLLSLLPVSVSAASDFPTVLAEAKKGVVQLYSLGRKGTEIHAGFGTGFAVGELGTDTNVFLTNWHVITMSGEFEPDEVRLWILQENCVIDDNTWEPDPANSISCEVLKTTTGYPDYGIIRATESVSGYMPLPLLSSETVPDGTTVYSLGYPAAVGDQSVSHYGIDDITSTDGMVSQHMQLAQKGNTWSIMHTARISSGNSGGPLINGDGAVVGINTYDYGTNDRFWAVYIDYAIEGLDELGLPYAMFSVPDANEIPETTDEADGETEPPETKSSETTPDETESDNDNKNDSNKDSGSDDDNKNKSEDEESNLMPFVAAGVLALVIAGVVFAIIQKKKKDEQRRQEELRRQEEQRRRDEQRRLEEQHRQEEQRQLEVQRRQEELRRRELEEQRRREQEAKAYIQLKGGSTYPIPASGAIIGRNPDCNIILPANAPGVGRRHCKLEFYNGRLILTDLSSTYGTFIHGKRIPANTPVELKNGSSFFLGSEQFQFTVR